MLHYLDTSVVVALLLRDAHSTKANAWLLRAMPAMLLSDFCAVEFAALVSRRVRMGTLAHDNAARTLEEFDRWRSDVVQSLHCAPEHIAQAEQAVRDFETKLNAADAVHLAVAKRIGVTLATFDARLAEAAARHGVSVIIPE